MNARHVDRVIFKNSPGTFTDFNIAVPVKCFWLFPLKFQEETLSSPAKAVKAATKWPKTRLKITEI